MIVFRVDANEQIASGHLMRCLTVAEECRRQGESCQFLLAEDKETNRIKDRGFSCHVLDSAWDQLDTEVGILQQYLAENPCKWLVVDSYQATAEYLRRLNEICPVLYLDDFGKEDYDVTAVLHYGLVQDAERYTAAYLQKGIRALVGPEYIPLREEFQPAHLAELQEKRQDRQYDHPAILITTGGTDPYQVTEQVLNYCLNDPAFRGCHYHVVAGSMNDHIQELQQLADRYSMDGVSPVSLHFGVRHMSDLMCQCDYAVSAGGTTLYELCACGIPTVCFSFADNQLPAVRMLEQQQIMRYAGDAREGNVSERIGKYLTEYIQYPKETIQYQEHMRELVDGRGVCRIVAFLRQKHVNKKRKKFKKNPKLIGKNNR